MSLSHSEFEIAVGMAAERAVWGTPKQSTLGLLPSDPTRTAIENEYHGSVGKRVLAKIESLELKNLVKGER